MHAFIMPERNTCTLCGAELLKGDPVYADNYDQVRSGMGQCDDCANPRSTAGDAESPVTIERDEREGSHDTPDPESAGIASKNVKVKSRRKAS